MNKQDILLELWHLRATRSSRQHYYSTHFLRVLDTIFTFVNVSASIAVLYLSAVPWFLNKDNHDYEIYLSISALIIVITSTVQYVFDFRARWKDHELAIGGYAVLNRRIEQAIATQQSSDDDIADIRNEFDRLSAQVPTPHFLFWNRPKWITKEEREFQQKLSGPAESN
jgi:hypothetical protein